MSPADEDDPRAEVGNVGIVVETLGNLRVVRDGEELSALPRQTVRCAVFLYLAVQREVTRDAVMGLLWPDKDPDRARGALNQTLYELRKVLGDDWVKTQGDFFRVSDEVEVDAARFEALVEEGDHEAALALYKGPFLAGSAPSAGIAFEHWSERQRSHYESEHRKARRGRVEALYETGDREGALAVARSWWEKDPLEDEAAHWVIRLLAELGRKSQALKAYDGYAATLKRELEVEPLDETKEFVERVRSGEFEAGTLAARGQAPGAGLQMPGAAPPAAERGPIFRLARAAVIVAAVVGGLWALSRPTPPPLDPNKVVGFPLVARGLDASVGEDISAYLGNALDHTGQLLWIDGWRRLPEEARSDAAAVTPRLAEDIARDRGAGHYIEGTVYQELSTVTVTLDLHSVIGDSLVDRASASGDLRETTATRVALDALTELLPSLVTPDRQFDLGVLRERSPSAIALWLQAERAYRTSDFELAADLYAEAVDEDSLLVVAALGGAVATSWLEEDEAALGFSEYALRHLDLLPAHYRPFALGLNHYFNGRADEAVAELRSAIEYDPYWPEAWMALGEVHRHLVTDWVRHDSMAAAAFTRASQLDGGFSPPLYHLVEYGLRTDLEIDSTDIRLRRFLQPNPGLPEGLSLQLMHSCAREGELASITSSLARSDPNAVVEAANHLVRDGRHLVCARDLLQVLFSQAELPIASRWGSVLLMNGIHLMAGDPQGAVEFLEWAEADIGVVNQLNYLLMEAAGFDSGARALRLVEFMDAQTGGDLSKSQPQFTYLMGEWAGVRGEIEWFGRLLDGIQRQQAQAPTEAGARFLAALQVRAAVLEGDSVRALILIDSLDWDAPRKDIQWDLAGPLASTRLLKAQLQYAQGELVAAYATAQTLEHPEPIAFLPFRLPSLQLQLRIAQDLGLREEAAVIRAKIDRTTMDSV